MLGPRVSTFIDAQHVPYQVLFHLQYPLELLQLSITSIYCNTGSNNTYINIHTYNTHMQYIYNI